VKILPEQYEASTDKTKGAMNKKRLKQNDIRKNLGVTEQRKSRLNSTRLKWNDTKGMLNEMSLT
jgi:hypothetical protein